MIALDMLIVWALVYWILSPSPSTKNEGQTYYQPMNGEPPKISPKVTTKQEEGMWMPLSAKEVRRLQDAHTRARVWEINREMESFQSEPVNNFIQGISVRNENKTNKKSRVSNAKRSSRTR